MIRYIRLHSLIFWPGLAPLPGLALVGRTARTYAPLLTLSAEPLEGLFFVSFSRTLTTADFLLCAPLVDRFDVKTPIAVNPKAWDLPSPE